MRNALIFFIILAASRHEAFAVDSCPLSFLHHEKIFYTALDSLTTYVPKSNSVNELIVALEQVESLGKAVVSLRTTNRTSTVLHSLKNHVDFLKGFRKLLVDDGEKIESEEFLLIRKSSVSNLKYLRILWNTKSEQKDNLTLDLLSLDNVISEIRELFPLLEIKVDLELSESDVKLSGNMQEIFDGVANLISNVQEENATLIGLSISYADSKNWDQINGSQVGSSYQAKRFTSSRVYNNEFVKFGIQNKGPLLNEEVVDSLFKEKNFTSKSSGTGIGLSETKEFIEEAGGSLSFSSGSGVVEFSFYLPAVTYLPISADAQKSDDFNDIDEKKPLTSKDLVVVIIDNERMQQFFMEKAVEKFTKNLNSEGSSSRTIVTLFYKSRESALSDLTFQTSYIEHAKIVIISDVETEEANDPGIDNFFDSVRKINFRVVPVLCTATESSSLATKYEMLLKPADMKDVSDLLLRALTP